MNVTFGSAIPGTTVSVDLRPSGLAFIAEIGIPVETIPRLSATLLLRWAEVVVIGLILAVAGMAVHFRDKLVATWLISTWAVHNKTEAAAVICFLSLAVGFLLAA
jgi:hypothetical protein